MLNRTNVLLTKQKLNKLHLEKLKRQQKINKKYIDLNKTKFKKLF